jgi:hypothetical protein
MTEPWYHIVDAPQPLSQGDLILDCPVLVWKRLDRETALPPTRNGKSVRVRVGYYNYKPAWYAEID